MSSAAHAHSGHAEGHHDNAPFGMWIYILTDCILFATMFAVYAVLSPATFGGPGPAQLFDLEFILVGTLLLLTSSFTLGLAMLAHQAGKIRQMLFALGATALLGAGFIGMELQEFSHLVHQGHGPGANAFLSSFFGLVGLHGLHVLAGLVWMVFVMVLFARRGNTPDNTIKLRTLSLFWHFLDVIWIFVFTFVYLLGALR
jgi:cytochrome o ubiquinol oxidase subunit 3